jgi:hypothetical protein
VIEQWIWPAVTAALAGVALVLVLTLVRGGRRHRRDLASARAEVEALRLQIEQIERVLTSPPKPEPVRVPEYAITDVGRSEAGDPPDPVRAERVEAGEIADRALFADLVLRETVVRAASLAHGVRRALAPETRNRIRFEVRREIRRARKQRRSDLKAARRDWEARQRTVVDDEDAA